MTPSMQEKPRNGERQLRWSRVAHAPSGRGRRPVALAIGVLLLVVPGASASHLIGTYNGTHSQGGPVRFVVPGPFASDLLFDSPAPIAGKTDLGHDCWPLVKPPGTHVAIVNHAFSETRTEVVPGFFTSTVTVSGSFSEPQSAGGTLRITSDRWSSPLGQPPPGSICDTGTLSWSASCSSLPIPCSAPSPVGGPSPTFSGSASRARVSTSGQVTLPLRIGCPPPGADCRVSVAASGRVPASTAARRKQVKLGRSDYLVRAGSSSKTRFSLTTKGLKILRRVKRIRAKLEVTVTRGSEIAKKTVTVRLKAPRQIS